ncbi:MAG TPA: hypothetical protein VNL71_15215, partial [Chloroflexota bacterium]|nr:hypothetical protein [Chloroflexota bacterium]
MKRVLFSMVTLFLVLGCNQGLVRVASGASPSYFRLDSNFTTNAERSVAQEESTYINTNDCANWIGTFLHGSYGLPVGWENDNASQLVRNLVSAGIGTVLTGDHHPDAGGLISHDDAQAAYFSDYSSYSNRLDQHMLEAGGSQEFLLAYQWNDDKTGNVFSHVALYVGGGKVIAHGATSDGTFATEGNLQAQAWDWYLNPTDQQTDWRVAIIALSSGPLRPAPAHIPPPSGGWTVDLSADQAGPAPGDVVTLTAQANQDLNGTGASLDIIDTTNNVLVASCVSGATCASQVTVDSADTISYVAQIGSNAQSDPLAVTWAVAQPIIDWSITLSADQTDAPAGATVNLTAEANADVGPTPDSIEI